MNLNAYFPAIAGGILIGIAASALLFANGRVLGVSGILQGLLFPRKSERSWRVSFIIGLLTGGVILFWGLGHTFALPFGRTSVSAVLAGVLVGLGTSLSNGCTSGHGICGVSRLSLRSIAATGTFMFSGMTTVHLVNQLLGLS